MPTASSSKQLLTESRGLDPHAARTPTAFEAAPGPTRLTLQTSRTAVIVFLLSRRRLFTAFHCTSGASKKLYSSGPGGTRTPYLLTAGQMFSQLNYEPSAASCPSKVPALVIKPALDACLNGALSRDN